MKIKKVSKKQKSVFSPHRAKSKKCSNGDLDYSVKIMPLPYLYGWAYIEGAPLMRKKIRMENRRNRMENRRNRDFSHQQVHMRPASRARVYWELRLSAAISILSVNQMIKI